MNDPRSDVDNPARFVADAPAPAGDDLLPPVEPPSASFIIQLFVIPALIVLLIVALWLSFNWLVSAASRPEDVIKGLEQGPSVARWQRASELADMLRNERFAKFKRDGKSAARLAALLNREIAAAGMDDNEVEFRKYLARALGEFQVQEGMEVLLKAATTNRDPREQKVRDGALQAIAVRAHSLNALDPPQAIKNSEVEPTLLQLSEEEDPLIRFQSAYALGKLGTPAAIERLQVLVNDPHADTRYNAAVALAHRGDATSIETLAEMLDLEEHASARPEKPDANAAMVRSVIVHTAIEATLALHRENPKADVQPIIEMLRQLADASPEQLAKAQLPEQARFDAERALDALSEPAAVAPAKTDAPRKE